MKNNPLRILAIILIVLIYPSIVLAAGQGLRGNCQVPLKGDDKVVTSSYFEPRDDHTGGIHGGIDWGFEDDYVYCMAPGRVAVSGPVPGYGYAVYVEHYDPETQQLYYSEYGHLNGACMPEIGTEVEKGRIIGYVDKSIQGSSTGPHLHFCITEGFEGPPVNPAEFIPNLDPAAVSTDGDWSFQDAVDGVIVGVKNKAISMAHAANIYEMSAMYFFGERIVSSIDKIVAQTIKGIGIIKDIIWYLFYLLITIDLAYAAAVICVDSQANSSILKFVTAKLALYSFVFFLITSWGPTVADMLRTFFVGTGATVLGKTEADAFGIISNPFILFQKGFHLVMTIYNDLMIWAGPLSFIPGLLSLQIIIFLLCCIPLILLAIITMKIVLAYIEFYMLVLFNFVMLIFAGTRQTRRYFGQSFTGIWASAVKLLYFTVFSLILEVFMQNLVVAPSLQQVGEMKMTKEEQKISGGNFGGPEGLDNFAHAIAMHESHGDYYIYNIGEGAEPGTAGKLPHGGDGGYGAYQFSGYYNAWGHEYEAAHPNGPHLHPIDFGCDPANSPVHFPGVSEYIDDDSEFSFCPENQDMIAKWKMMELYNGPANHSWRNVAMYWHYGKIPPNGDYKNYWSKVCGTAGDRKFNQIATASLTPLVLLTALILLFMFIGDRLTKQVMELTQGEFKFTNDD